MSERVIHLKNEKIPQDVCNRIISQSDASHQDLLDFSNSISIHQSTVTIKPGLKWSFLKEREVP